MQRTLFGLPFLLVIGSAAASPPAGGGPAPSLPTDTLGPMQRVAIDAQLAANVAALEREDRLAPLRPVEGLQTGLQWPLHPVSGWRDPGYHGISNFVDLNNAIGVVGDWNCGTRSYDLSAAESPPNGYNHAGIDIFLWPFAWRTMDAQSVDIVAAAPGQIIGKVDGNDDRSCPGHYSSDWNAVYVRHGDGSVAWYGHMKLGSLTSKAIGATVSTGEFLGKIGSAGFSTGPHLHFENHSAVTNYQILEPFAGACRAGASLWAAQPPYYDSRINKISTNSAAPDFATACPNPGQETPNFKDRFQPGETYYFVLYYRDQLLQQVAVISILRPNGSVAETINFKMADATADPYYNASYWYWWRTLPAGAPSGVWRIHVVYEGETYEHRFFVGDVIHADGFEGG